MHGNKYKDETTYRADPPPLLFLIILLLLNIWQASNFKNELKTLQDSNQDNIYLYIDIGYNLN